MQQARDRCEIWNATCPIAVEEICKSASVTAFSRDQANKVYVQHRLLENAKEVYAWLQEGAHFYVCGDEARMAKDVDIALHQIVAKEGGLSPEAAAAYVEALRKEKRYKRDVY